MIRLHYVQEGPWYGHDNVAVCAKDKLAEFGRLLNPDGEWWDDGIKHEGMNMVTCAGDWTKMRAYANEYLEIQEIKLQNDFDLYFCWTFYFDGCTLRETLYRNDALSMHGTVKFTFDFYDETLAVQFKLEML
jgi:hypothetical protein